eukprot:TRINITY_DN11226_c0_g1_i1.p1 TRINITY_DN11226_c0_g1~~TRINITY_DN11226_c0_g1_i1.p1  ORF type:complete len:117 (-),score=26.51 TRINITY_DN11226_c0_g1_i1:241-570(-)
MATEDWTGPDLWPDWKRFLELAAGPSASSLKTYLESGGSPETRYANDWTFLGYAMYCDEKEHVKLLMEYEVNPNLLCDDDIYKLLPIYVSSTAASALKLALSFGFCQEC